MRKWSGRDRDTTPLLCVIGGLRQSNSWAKSDVNADKKLAIRHHISSYDCRNMNTPVRLLASLDRLP